MTRRHAQSGCSSQLWQHQVDVEDTLTSRTHAKPRCFRFILCRISSKEPDEMGDILPLIRMPNRAEEMT